MLLLLALVASPAAMASHIAGGELTYDCLGGNQYRLRYVFFRDCTGAELPSSVTIGIFDNNENQLQSPSLSLVSTSQLDGAAPSPCTEIPPVCLIVGVFEGIVTLPPRPGGYVLAYEQCCRNNGIVNGPSGTAAYTTSIPDIALATCNSSPDFLDWPPVFICADEEFVFDNSATDPDGDVLVYSLCTPYEAIVPSTPYPFNTPPYSAANPLGNGSLTIDPVTGILTGTPGQVGRHVVGVCVSEYRNGVLINTTTRDFQLNVVACTPLTTAAGLSALTNCATGEVTFFNTSTNGSSFLWNLGDGTTSTLPGPVHTYADEGAYTATLIAFNGTDPQCNDTTTVPVTVTECLPCGMTVQVTTTPGICNPQDGCYRFTYVHPCGTSTSISYGNLNISGNCVGGLNINTGTAPLFSSVGLGVDGVSLPTAATTVTQTFLGPATSCPGNMTSTGTPPNVTLSFNAVLTQPQTGSATATIAGGTPPYVVQWTTTPSQTGNTATGVHPGTYSVIVTDANGCVVVTPFAVAGTSDMVLNASSTDVTACGADNGTLSVSVTGNQGPVTYLWTPGGYTTANVQNVPPGTYTVLVSDAVCSATATVTVDDVATIAVTASVTGYTCATAPNGSATVTSTTGGTPPYTYTWNTNPVQTGTSVTGLPFGFYTVTATDQNGCTGTFSFTVSGPPALQVEIETNDPVCHDDHGSAMVTATGGAFPYTYAWNTSPPQFGPMAMDLHGGDPYEVTVTDANGCSITETVILAEPPHIHVDLINVSTISCAGVFSGGIFADVANPQLYTYSWTCTSQTTGVVTGLAPGPCTVTVTDQAGCTEQATMVVQPLEPLTVTVDALGACGGQETGVATAIGAGGNAPYSYAWSCSGATTQAVADLAGGTSCTVTLTDDAGCTATATTTIPAHPSLSLGTASVTPGCPDNGAIDLEVTGGTPGFVFQWSNGLTTEDLSGLVAPATFTVSAFDANNCFDTLSVFVGTDCSTHTVTASGGSTCAGGCAEVVASHVPGASGDLAPYTYTWSDGVPDGPGPHTVCPTQTTTYTVTVTNANGTAVTATATVEVLESPTLSIAATDVLCLGGTDGTATVTPTGGLQPYTYAWNTTPPQNAPSISGLPVGTWNVTVTDANGCTATDSVSIASPGELTATASAIAVSCAGGADGSATVQGAGGTAPYTVAWNTVPPQTGTTASGLTAGTWSVTITDANGCTADADATVVEPAPLLAQTTATPAGCNATDGSAAVDVTGGTAPYTYAWNTTPPQNGATATGLSAGSWTVTVTDAAGCQVDATATVTTTSGGVLAIDPTDATCNGAADGEATVTITGGEAPFAVAWNTVPPQTAPTATGLPAGDWEVTVTDAAGCVLTAVAVIGEPSAIAATVTTTAANCGLSNGAATAVVTGGTLPYSYSWNTVPGQSDPIASGIPAGSWTVTVTDANGCLGTAEAVVADIPGPVANFSFSNLCFGDAVAFTNTSSSSAPPGVFTSDWLLGDGTATSVTSPSHTYPATGAFTVTLTVTDTAGCTSSVSQELNIEPIPVVAITADPTEGCVPFNTTLLNSGPPVGGSCLWNLGDGTTATDCAMVMHQYAQEGCYTVTLTVTSPAGCVGQQVRDSLVCASAAPVAGFTFGPDPVPTDQPLVRFFNNSLGADSFLWEFFNGDTTTQRDPVLDVSGVEPGAYSACLSAWNEQGCADSTCVTFRIAAPPLIYVPNAFTPDGDGFNDVFLPVVSGDGIKEYRFQVFNRWGELLFESEEPGVAWTGMYNGVLSATGVYVWKVRVKHGDRVRVEDLKGHVSLLR